MGLISTKYAVCRRETRYLYIDSEGHASRAWVCLLNRKGVLCLQKHTNRKGVVSGSYERSRSEYRANTI